MGSVVKGPVDWEVNAKNWGSTDQKDWRKRTIAIRKLLGDDVRSVIDVGAGSMFLGKLLPPNVRYYPLDYEPHCDETLVCDLNAYQFPDVKADAAVLAGILGYLNDVDWLFDTLVECVSVIVLSYQGKEKGFSHSLYTTEEIINKLRQRGFVLTGWDKELEDQWPLIGRFQKAQPQLLAASYFCTGCGVCANSCKAGAVELKPDFQGFLKPQIDAAKCVGCNRCVEVCPSAYLHENDHFTEPDCYAAWARDDIRMDSSSGGVFTVLAQSILSKGGVVFGAAWTEDFHLEHIGIRDIEELPKLRHSKYVQSNTKDTFRQVREILESGSPVLYVGTPCQIAGLHSFLGKPYAGLYAVDLICFCVTPVTAFRKYLSEQYGIENVQNVVFRDKYRGWWADGYSIHKEDGSVLRLGIDTDDYQKAFHNVLCRNKTCDDCPFADFPRRGDITLGDFWGIDQHDPSWNDGKGTSIILVNSEKGQHLLDTVKVDFLRIEQVPLEWTRGKGNRIGKDGRPRHKRAEDFLTNLDKHTFRESLDTALIDKHDIGLVCLHNNNYGNNLTNYALYQYLNDCGYSVAMIDQTLDAPLMPQARKLSLFGRIPYKAYDLFPNAENKVQLKKSNDQCDIFVVGSDQLFRASFSQDMDMHPCMDWVASNKPKISYATSFGVEYFEGDEKVKAKMAYYLKRFQALSVRESSGIKILKQDFGIDGGVCVLDPVFLCDRRHYENMARFGKMRLPSTAYLGGYILDPSKPKADFVDKIKTESGLKEISIISDGDEEYSGRDTSELWQKTLLGDALVEEWLANVLCSDVFVTDSFHGACFALIFEKDFWIVTSKRCWRGGERLRDLVSALGIEDRLVLEEDDLSKIDFHKHIDYSRVNQLINQKREDSKNWLLEKLAEGKAFSGDYETYDILGERIDNNTVRLQRVEEKTVAEGKMLENLLRNSTAYLESLLKNELSSNQQAIFENLLRNSTAYLEGLLKDGLSNNQQSELELWQQIQTQIQNKIDEAVKGRRASEQQLYTLLENEMKARKVMEGKLEEAHRENRELQNSLSKIYSSNSWRMTWPFRKIAAFISRLFKHNG